MPCKPLAAALLGLLTLLVHAGSAAAQTGLRPVDPVSPNVEQTLHIYYLLLVFAGIVFLAVTVPLVVFAVRYRAKGRARDVEGPQIRGNTALELAWTGVPIVILVITASFVFYKLPGIVDIVEAGEEPLTVTVEGRQFYWRYVYPNGVVAIDRLRAPVGRTVVLRLTAPDNDVIHSYWVPPVGGKKDAIPGRIVETQFRARETGVFQGACAEFCGVQHAAMHATIEVLPENEFDAWIDEQAEQQEAGEGDLGLQLWSGACAKCHGGDEAGVVAPGLGGNPTLEQRDALELIVRNGRGAMPAVGQGWTETEMDALFEFVSEQIFPQEAPGDGD